MIPKFYYGNLINKNKKPSEVWILPKVRNSLFDYYSKSDYFPSIALYVSTSIKESNSAGLLISILIIQPSP